MDESTENDDQPSKSEEANEAVAREVTMVEYGRLRPDSNGRFAFVEYHQGSDPTRWL